MTVHDYRRGTCGPCPQCRKTHSQRAAQWRARQRQRRKLVDGRLVALHLPPDKHGLASTYTNYGCQCPPCTTANSTRRAEGRRRDLAGHLADQQRLHLPEATP